MRCLVSKANSGTRVLVLEEVSKLHGMISHKRGKVCILARSKSSRCQCEEIVVKIMTTELSFRTCTRDGTSMSGVDASRPSDIFLSLKGAMEPKSSLEEPNTVASTAEKSMIPPPGKVCTHGPVRYCKSHLKVYCLVAIVLSKPLLGQKTLIHQGLASLGAWQSHRPP